MVDPIDNRSPSDANPALAAAGRDAGPALAARRRTGIGLLISVLLAVTLTWAEATGAALLAEFDTSLTDITRGWADAAGWPVTVAGLIGDLTAPFWSTVAAAVLIVWLGWSGYRAAAGFLASSVVCGLLVSELGKRLMSRTRPPGAEQFGTDLDRAFPSGHAMVGIYLYLAAGLILVQLGRAVGRRWLLRAGVLLMLSGPVIGLSRLVLGVHWPSDVLAGWSFGSAVLCACALLLWAPLAQGWTPRASDPEPPGADARPDPPAR